MADRTSAEIFGKLFEHLATQPESEARAATALWAWEFCKAYDFSPYQMDADEALLTLKLAQKVTTHQEEFELLYSGGR